MPYVDKKALIEKEKKVYYFMYKKMVRREYKKQVMNIDYLIIAKGTGLTYKEVRNAVARLSVKGKITKFKAWHKDTGALYRRRNWYQIPTLLK